MKLKLLLAILLPLTASCTEPDIAKISWPKSVCNFPNDAPDDSKVTFTVGAFQISRLTPYDPLIQAAGGSGGPIVEFSVRDIKGHWSTVFTTQSVGERILESYRGKPQIEIWGRGGGGYWSRHLYRYITDEYRCVRTDQFEERPRHNNLNAPTTEMPSARRGKGDQQSDTLYFIETRILTNCRDQKHRRNFCPAIHAPTTSHSPPRSHRHRLSTRHRCGGVRAGEAHSRSSHCMGRMQP